MRKSRIGILTGGGDCAGLNPAIKWVVKSALDERLMAERGKQYEVVGIKDGWKGLIDIESSIVPLDEKVVRTWDRYGGTMLGTSRTNPYNPGNDCSKTVIANIEKLELDALVTIGGDDTLSVAHKLSKEGIKIVGIPKTIDKDLCETDYTLGFETAVEVITEEIDRLRITADSHKRVFVVETMGRDAGWLALEGGESSGAFMILIPEYDFSIEKVNRLVMDARKDGTRHEIIVVAEGAKPSGGTQSICESTEDAFGHNRLGGIAEWLAAEIHRNTKIDTRSLNLSYLQRGGNPCAYDRRMGRYFGIAAIDLIAHHRYGLLVCYRNGKITSSPFENVIGRMNRVNVDTQYDVDRYNGRHTIIGKEMHSGKPE
ncbi:MAG: ATP-dependent 6-phosphofructokinase [Dehalococcoidales bacterium]|nr:ATP-dependent 6-phosphofructokinase [Dehalococcoidales bacterium]